jgi:hypothetical protein
MDIKVTTGGDCPFRIARTDRCKIKKKEYPFSLLGLLKIGIHCEATYIPHKCPLRDGDAVVRLEEA